MSELPPPSCSSNFELVYEDERDGFAIFTWRSYTITRDDRKQCCELTGANDHLLATGSFEELARRAAWIEEEGGLI